MGTSSNYRDELHKAEVAALLDLAGERQDLVKDLIRRVFPAAIRHFENNSYGSDWLKSWLRRRLAAHGDILRLYVERVVPSGLSAYNDGERAFALLSDAEAFNAFLADVEPERLEDVIAALETFEGDYPVDAVPSAVATLLALKPLIPERTRGFLDPFSSDIIVDRVVLRMLRQYSDRASAESAVLELWPQLDLSGRLELLRLVSRGKTSNADSELVTEEFVDERRAELVGAVNAAALSDLARERRFVGLLLATGEWSDKLRTISVDEPPAVHRAVLSAAQGLVRSQSTGSRHVRSSPTLDWNLLEQLYGSEDDIRAGSDAVRGEYGDAELELAKLVDKYLAGYRHESFDPSDEDGPAKDEPGQPPGDRPLPRGRTPCFPSDNLVALRATFDDRADHEADGQPMLV